MNNFSHVPPGFRFHPTDEELVDYYLRKKIASKRIDLDVIKDVDLYKIEPWDLQELCGLGTEEQNEWYFFSHKDKKYPTGTRTNRATRAGFWKATGRDKAIYSKNNLVGMRKTLVFYQGRAPNGQKSDWIMHEYRLETNENGTPQEEGWAVCRVFKKRMPTIRREGEHEALCWYDDQVSFMPDFDSPRRISHQPNYINTSYHPHYSCKQELDHHHHHSQYQIPHDPFLQLPQLESPKIPQSSSSIRSCSSMVPYSHENLQQSNNQFYVNNSTDQVTTDWRVLDKFVASQLSHENASKDDAACYTDVASLQEVAHEDLNMLVNDSRREEMASELGSAASSSSQMDMWK